MPFNKRTYMQSYVTNNPERMHMYRKREILQRARQQHRLPSKRSIVRYSITADELRGLIRPILEARSN
jgi:hypothetical protein